MNVEQIEYLLKLLDDKSKRLHEEHKAILKSKHLGLNHVNAIISAMELNNELIVHLQRMKKEEEHGVFGFNN